MRETVRVYSEGPEDSMSRSLARYVQRVAGALRAVAPHPPDGAAGPLQPRQRPLAFNQRGFPAVVFREANENFAKQHAATDTIDGVDFALPRAERARERGRRGVARARAAGAGVTNERGQPTIGRQPSGYDANLRWSRRRPGAVGYRIYWRDAWSNDWQHTQAVGNVTEFVLPNLSIDDYVFGVAAIGAGRPREPGQRLRVAAAPRPRVKLVPGSNALRRLRSTSS